MFYIDDFNKEEVTFENAVNLVNSYGCEQGLLENLKSLREKLMMVQDHEYFYDNWCYEINAYNKVFSEMGKLFGENV